jgi:hypothetical protein
VSDTLFVTLNLIIALLLAVLWYLTVHLHHLLAPLWLLRRGEYKRAREHYEATLRSAFRMLPGIRDVSYVGLASCLAGEGRIEEGLTVMRLLPVQRQRRNVRYVVDVRVANMLLFLGREHAEIEVRVNRALEVHVSPELILIRALAQLALGRPEDAAKSYDQAIALPARGSTLLGMTMVVRFDAAVRAQIDLYRGWYLTLTNRKDEARPFLELATLATPAMAAFARRLLEGLGPAPPDDDRPSLLPMTVSSK